MTQHPRRSSQAAPRGSWARGLRCLPAVIVAAALAGSWPAQAAVICTGGTIEFDHGGGGAGPFTLFIGDIGAGSTDGRCDVTGVVTRAGVDVASSSFESNGILSVTGTGTTLTIDSGLTVQVGTGRIDITDGAVVEVLGGLDPFGGGFPGTVSLGNGSGSAAVVNIVGSGSELRYTGSNGLTIANGNPGFGVAGAPASATVILRDGGALSASNSLIFVGLDAGSIGSLSVVGGSVSTTASPLAALVAGANPGASGHVSLSGNTSSMTLDTHLRVGPGGTGGLTILDGGKVTTQNADNSATFVGASFSGPGAHGTALVKGAGSELNVNHNLAIGVSSVGTASGHVSVQDGGKVSARRVDVGSAQNGQPASGSLVVQGSGALVRLTGEDPANPGSGAQLTVGNAGARGSLMVTGGGRIEMDTTGLPGPGDPNLVTGSRLRVGAAFGLGVTSVGSAIVAGTGSQVDIQTAVVAGGVQVGRDGSTGDLTVLNGASITVSGPAPVFIVGREANSRGTVNVGSGGSLVLVDTDSGGNGRLARDPGSFAAVTVDGAGSLLEVPGILTLGLRNSNAPPVLADQGGSAVLTVANGGTVRVSPDGSGILRLGSGDILKGNGVINANVESFGGVVLPGLSPGLLTINGSYFGGPGSQLVLEVSGAGHDTMQVTGAVQFGPGASISVVVDPVNPPAPGQTFTLIEGAGTPLVEVVTASSGAVGVQTSGAASQVPTTVSTGGTVSTVIEIDVKDKVHTKGHGVLPVAILSGSTFAAPLSIDPETIRLAGASVRLAGKSGKFQCATKDVNHDTLPDLECNVNVDELELQVGDTVAVLNAASFCNPLQPPSPINCNHFTGSQAITVKN